MDAYNGINLSEEKEFAWLSFLLSAHHFGIHVVPEYLCSERFSFRLSLGDLSAMAAVSADEVIAELLRKFEAWNYA
jgi:hypothetical protein